MEDSMDQREDYEDGWGWWHRSSSTGSHWGHREPQESASPTLATQVQQVSEMAREMQRHFVEVVGSAGNAAGRGWQETWQETEWQSLPDDPETGRALH